MDDGAAQTPAVASNSGGGTGAGLRVTGAQALKSGRGYSDPQHQQLPRADKGTAKTMGRSSIRKTSGVSASETRASGKAWAILPGRDRPVHWAPQPGSGTEAAAAVKVASSANDAGLGLCLDIRAAGRTM